MKLYLISYQTHWNTHIDLGRAVVLAANPTEAIQALAVRFNLPMNKSEFNAEVIEDGVMNLSKRSVEHDDAAAPHNLNRMDESEFREYRPPALQYNCQILAIATGDDEWHALKRLAHTVINKCNQQSGQQDKHVTKLMINAEPRVPGHEKLKPMEQVELYKGKGIVRS